jgi:hypothetical protein
VHREQLVVLLVGEELEPGLGQLAPDAERESPAMKKNRNELIRYMIPIFL